MSLLKFFLNGSKWAHRTGQEISPSSNDPLQHPDLEIMSLTELADLPLMPANLGRRASEIKKARKTLSRPQHG